ncbi:hypothetical protein NDU88_004424 [Pleurodeles waltl]|uniref:Uncharacterized protein n=1 Tax=Pleurodeles waltl TaxID=8319 RepID=A0AAV7VI80_PLEWA|nr:hypothetical protein NDU88_004424 [Pleurodeles waltl]
MEEREATRTATAAEIFNEAMGSSNLNGKSSGVAQSYGGVKMKLREWEKQSRKEINKWWELFTLRKYVRVNRIRRGLRIGIMPSHQDASNELLEEWGAHILDSSKGLVLILIKHAEIALNKIQNQLRVLEQEIEGIKLTEEESKIRSEMAEKIPQHEETVKIHKQTKFQRDKSDYEEGRIFTVATRFQNAKLKEQIDVSQIKKSDKSSNESRSTDNESSEGESISPNTQGVKLTSLNEMRLALQQESKDQQVKTRGRGRGRGAKGTNPHEGDKEGKQRKTRAQTAAIFKS